MIKATTEHGTYYIIDLKEKMAKRVREESRNEMLGDGNWFAFSTVEAFDRNTNKVIDGGVQLGKSIYFNLIGAPRFYDWRISTNVCLIEDVK